ncbi:zinc-dependent alcohol dehydrogenase, partial [Mangrovicoccus algicola]
MKAVRLHGVQDLRVEQIADPGAPGPGELRIAVTMAGICGSDLHNFRNGAWISRAPSVAGHEFTGTVAQVGAGVDHVAPGDAVIVDSRVTCGNCGNCRAGLAQVCETMGFVGEAIDGGFAEQVILPARNVIAAPAGLPARHLAMAEPLAVALHALERIAVPPGAPLVVAGCGPIGALVALLAAGRGHAVHVIDRQAA